MLQGEDSAILSTFIKLQLVIKIIVLSVCEWSFYTGFTVTVITFFADDTLCIVIKLLILHCGTWPKAARKKSVHSAYNSFKTNGISIKIHTKITRMVHCRYMIINYMLL